MSYEAWGEPDDPYFSPDQLAELGWISPDEYSKGAIDVLNERLRQQNEEGWTPEHDDALTDFQLARYAREYVMHAGYNNKVRRDRERRGPTALHASAMAWFKPSTRRRDLVKAGALILAEIDRLDRLEARSAEGREPDRAPAGQAAPPEGQPPAGGETPREAK